MVIPFLFITTPGYTNLVEGLNPLAANKNPSPTHGTINMEPQNGGLEDEFPFQLGDSQVPYNFSGLHRMWLVYWTTGP